MDASETGATVRLSRIAPLMLTALSLTMMGSLLSQPGNKPIESCDSHACSAKIDARLG